MTGTPFGFTLDQIDLLANNDGWVPIATLDDGDLLIFQDAGPMGGPYEGAHIAKYLPWVLTRDGKVQGISYHYENHHEVGAPLDGPHLQDVDPSPALDTSLLITLESARVYLADVYDIELTTRTLRNYCASRKLECVRLSSKDKSPWYTEVAALEKLAQEWIEVEDLAPLPSDDPRWEMVDG